jgi:hypothetical protein
MSEAERYDVTRCERPSVTVVMVIWYDGGRVEGVAHQAQELAL